MTTPTVTLGPPPAVDDPRRIQWDTLLWKYIVQGVQTENASGIISERVFRQRDGFMSQAPGLDVADSQLMTAAKAFKQVQQSPMQDVAEKQLILATQIFGG